jgi:hypothetical protein
MDIEKFAKRIGYIFSFFGGLLLIIQAFAPNEFNNSSLDFILTVLKNGIVDLIVILFIGLLILYYKKLWDKIKTHNSIKYWILGTLAILLLVNFNHLKSFPIARYYHYSNITKAYKYQFYDKISENLNSIDYLTAIKNIDKIISFYPEEELHLGSLRKSLIGRIDYSQQIFSLKETVTVVEINENGDSIINKNKLVRLLQSFSIYPHKKYEDQLVIANKVLKKALSEFETNYNISGPDYQDFILQKYSWLVFDDNLSNSLKYRNIEKRDFLHDMLTTNTKNENIEFLNNQWSLWLIEEKINWKENLYFCSDYKTAANILYK